LDGPLDLMDNEALPDLNAFSALTSRVYAVLVNDNDMLTDVSGLAGIGDMELIGHMGGALPPFVAGQFAITNNDALCVESVSTLIGALLSKNPDAFALSPLYAGNREDCGG
jgi:hypothetical protein